jgi:type II secretory pathway component GspD/PulD (secretin)
LELLYNAYGMGSLNIGNILFISTREKIKQGTAKTKVVELTNINIDDAKALISNIVTTVNMSKETNTLVLIGAPEDIARAEKILKEVDLPQPQVLLEAKVVEINDDALKEIGIDYPDSITVSFQETARPATLPSTATSEGNFLHIYSIARNALQFSTILKMLVQQDKAKVLSSPSVTTMNNKEAEIFIGDKIPYTITTVTGGAASTEVRFVEPGIRLKITPSIVEEDFVVIKIEPEVSYIYSWRGTGDQYPWVKARQATAYVRVKNGESFAMGGLLTKEDKKNIYSLPFLGKIPFLGKLFTYEKITDKRTDLIITVTPTIISGKS